MVASNDNPDVISGPQTRCSNCQTVFEVPQELLESSDTRVRCGECLCIFDALAGLHDNSSPEVAFDDEGDSFEEMSAKYIETASNTHDFSSLDVTYSDFDLFSEDADLPEVAYLDKTQQQPRFDFDEVEPDHDETFSDTLFNHDVTINADMSLDAATLPTPQPAPPDDEPDESVSVTGARPEAAGEAPDEVSGKTEPAVRAEPATALVLHDDVPGDNFSGKGSANQKIDGRKTGSGVGDNHEVTDLEVNDPEAVVPAVQAKVEFGNLVQSPADPLAFNYYEQETLGDGVDGAAQVPPEALSDVPVMRASGSGSRWVWRLLMLLCLSVLIASLYVYRERDKLYNNATARPFFVAMCHVTGCELPAQFDAARLRTLHRSIYSHPEIENALVVNVVFRNDATYEQRYPVLMISLLDNRGTQVASRDFYPLEYLDEKLWNDNRLMAPGMKFDISLEISDPGSDADSFKLSFR